MSLTPLLALPLISMLFGATAGPIQSLPEQGEIHELTLTRDSVEQSGDGNSQGSSHDRDLIIERVLKVDGDGVELEYDLPATTNPEERKSQWQFPVRVLKSPDDHLHLLDVPQLETRIDRWLKEAGWTHAICGHWIFTWNGFKIDCDPQSALRTVKAFDLPAADVHDGADYSDPDAVATGKLTKQSSEQGEVFSTELEVNPEAVREARAETDVGIGEVTNKPITLDAALRKHANDEVSGTISITLETDSAGRLVRRTKVTKLRSKEPNGKSKTEMTTEVLERTALPTR